MTHWSIGDDTLDVSEMTGRVDELREQFGITDEDSAAREEMRQRMSDDEDEEWEELETLEKALDALSGEGHDFMWEGSWYPSTLIHETHFTDYAKQVAEDTGAVSDTTEWPNNHIDWDTAADELMGDYMSVTVGYDTYYYR